MINLQRIQQIVAQHYCIKLSDLLAGSKSRTAVRARHLGVYLCKKLTKETWEDIADFFGDLNIAATRKMYKKVCRLMVDNDQYKLEDTILRFRIENETCSHN